MATSRLIVLAAVLACAGCSSVPATLTSPPTSTAATATPSPGPTAVTTMIGCAQTAGDRPDSNGSTDAPEVANPNLDRAAPGVALGGGFDFTDAQADASEVIVQVGGAANHHVCALSDTDRANGHFDLGVLQVSPDFTPGTYLVYVAVRDAAANVSSYLVLTLVVGEGGAIQVCGAEPIQLMGAVPSESTAFYREQNGAHPDYRAGSTSGDELTIIATSTVEIDLGSCTKLLLAGSEGGTQAVGWDNCLIAESRAIADGSVEGRWSYCSPDIADIWSIEANVALTEPLAATVAGNVLDPPVPSGGPFGHQPLAIDLATELAGATTFELTLWVLDQGSVGSTTEIWAFPQ